MVIGRGVSRAEAMQFHKRMLANGYILKWMYSRMETARITYIIMHALFQGVSEQILLKKMYKKK